MRLKAQSNGLVQAGFTLLEVMVALMIFATAAVALTKSITESASSTGALEERQFADLVANNQLVAMLSDGYNTQSGSTQNTGTVSMAGYDFKWTREQEDTPHPKIRRVNIIVQLTDGTDTLASRTAYLEK